MGFLDKVKQMFSGNNAQQTKNRAQGVAKKIDAKAEELSHKDGAVGTVASKAHDVLDKVDGD